MTTSDRSGRQPLEIDVVHGDLRRVDAAVMVGSYDGTPIAGAERALDGRLGGALTRRLALGRYPGAHGTQAVVRDVNGIPPAVIIGMGDSGDVTAAWLASGITSAVLELLAQEIERSAGPEPVRLKLGTVLIGTTGPAALAVQSSVVAIVDGVRAANRRLRDLNQPGQVAVLQFVELYEERAIDAGYALASLDADLDGPDPLIVQRRLLTGIGGRRGQPGREYHSDEWRTVRVVEVGELISGGPENGLRWLSFTSLGRSARAEQYVNVAQRRLIDRLVDDSINLPVVPRQLYNTLYELLLPPAMKSRGRERDNVMYVVDEQAAALPLELLATRPAEGQPRPIALDVGVVRRLETRSSRNDVRIATGASALVIGNPPAAVPDATSGEAARGLVALPALPGAATEAIQVAEVLLSHGFRVTEIVAGAPVAPAGPDIDAAAVVNALFEAEYRVLHIAGHGVYRPDDPARSGVVIGDDVYLTAAEILQMRAVPELVFLNCCHLAGVQPGVDPQGPDRPGVDRHFNRIAASIARALIDAGVRAVVAAGWAVDDSAAAVFAEVFYQRMLAADDLGQATLAARQAAHEACPGSNTWGAYQVYGPPAFRLHTASDPTVGPLVARREFRERLEDLVDLARYAGDTDRRKVVESLDTLLSEAPEDWLGGDERGSVAEVWEHLGDYRRALDGYEQALHRWGGRAEIRAIERLANLLLKAAVEVRADDPATLPEGYASVDEMFDRAAELLQRLSALIGKTPEREALLGSGARRRAYAARDPERRRTYTRRSADFYRDALKIYREGSGGTDFYTGINHVVMATLATLLEGGDPQAEREAFTALLEECVRAAAETIPSTFWSRAAEGDVLLAKRLLDGDLVAAGPAIVESYRFAFSSGATPAERRAVTEHLAIVAELLPERFLTEKAALDDARKALIT